MPSSKEEFLCEWLEPEVSVQVKGLGKFIGFVQAFVWQDMVFFRRAYVPWDSKL